MPYPAPHTHTHTSSPTINIPHQSGTLVTIDESTLTHHYHPDPGVCIRVHAWCCMFHAIWHTYNNMYPPLSYDTEEFYPHKNPLYSDLFIPFLPGYFIFIWLRKKKFTYFISCCLSGNMLVWDLRILTQWSQKKGNWGQGRLNDSQREMRQGWARAWVSTTPLSQILREPGSGSLSRHKLRGAHRAKSAYKSP